MHRGGFWRRSQQPTYRQPEYANCPTPDHAIWTGAAFPRAILFLIKNTQIGMHVQITEFKMKRVKMKRRGQGLLLLSLLAVLYAAAACAHQKGEGECC